ncbi:hypothetical protein BJY52DRAFT_305621 [Lactarius psammicola]|nr:hypothetical protein BJY52DRAFT_305621 [Lactarius psammicola]
MADYAPNLMCHGRAWSFQLTGGLTVLQYSAIAVSVRLRPDGLETPVTHTYDPDNTVFSNGRLQWNMRLKPSSRAQWRLACAPKCMPFSSLSSAQAASWPHANKDVPHQQPRWHRLTSDVLVLRYISPTSLTKSSGCADKSADTNTIPPSFPDSYYAACNFMRQQALVLKMVFNRPVPVNHLVSAIADSASLHRVQLLPHPLFPPFPRCIRGPSEYAGI